jgi:hypothetical protein
MIDPISLTDMMTRTNIIALHPDMVGFGEAGCRRQFARPCLAP